MQTTKIKKQLDKVSTDYLKPDSDENKAINAFLNGVVGKFGQFFALPNALVHRRLDCDYKTGEATVCESIIAMHLNGNKIGNSSVLPMLNAHKAFGEWSYNRNISSTQEKISQFITMIPFTVFDEAQLDIRKLNIVEKLNEETIVVRIDNPKHDGYGTKAQKAAPKYIDEKRHFTGACLFEVEGTCFLFDIDRQEIKHKIFNPFLAQIPIKVTSVSEAYRALKPIDVTLAEMQGLEVVRQGEWFFIPVKGEHTPDLEELRGGSTRKRMELRAGDNRPNYAEMGVEALGLVKGKVEHSGREHKPVMLSTWHRAVPNTATKSFTISGQVD